MPSWRSSTCLIPSGSSAYWASDLHGMGLRSIPTRRVFVDFRNTESTGTTHPEADGTTFTFLGFTHIWGKSRGGNNVVRQVTAKNRYARALAAVTAWCRINRHHSDMTTSSIVPLIVGFAPGGKAVQGIDRPQCRPRTSPFARGTRADDCG